MTPATFIKQLEGLDTNRNQIQESQLICVTICKNNSFDNWDLEPSFSKGSSKSPDKRKRGQQSSQRPGHKQLSFQKRSSQRPAHRRSCTPSPLIFSLDDNYLGQDVLSAFASIQVEQDDRQSTPMMTTKAQKQQSTGTALFG